MKNQLGIVKALSESNLINLHIYFIGKAQPDYLNLVEEEINKNSLTEQITILPPQKNIEQYYQAADGLILNSDFEGSPNVIMEGMACQLPIISTNVGDVSYYVEDSCGWIIPPKNNLALVQALLSFGSLSEKERNNIGENARSILLEKEIYEDLMVKKHEEIYSELLSKEPKTLEENKSILY